MKTKDFERFSKEHIAFHIPDKIPDLLKESLKKIDGERVKILDMGCGECNLLIQLIKNGIKADFYGIDISRKKIERARKITKGKINLEVADCIKTQFKNNFFDLVIGTQIIEHINDKKFVDEVYRVLKKDGIAYITSVRRKKIAVYFYRKNGKFISDPSHEREYSSKREFMKLFKKFKIIKYYEEQFKHPLLDLYFRFFIKIKLVNPDELIRIYERSKLLLFIRNLIKMPLIGFFHNEIIVQKN